VTFAAGAVPSRSQSPPTCGGDGWESNPPGTPQQGPTDGFEDRGEHQLPYIPSGTLLGAGLQLLAHPANQRRGIDARASGLPGEVGGQWREAALAAVRHHAGEFQHLLGDRRIEAWRSVGNSLVGSGVPEPPAEIVQVRVQAITPSSFCRRSRLIAGW
jgi:hypothetical protein